MCKTKKIDWSLLKPTKVHGLLKNFPACGVRYKTDGDYGLVLVHPKIKDQRIVSQKRDAAKIKSLKAIYIVDIPLAVVRAMRL